MVCSGPTIRFMQDNIRRLGGDLHAGNIYCQRCDERMAGGFDPAYGIRICANEMRNRGHVEDTLAHGSFLVLPSPMSSLRGLDKIGNADALGPDIEMIHAWDHLRFKVDWYGNLRHAACTEIRASSLSGECRFWREFVTRGQWKVSQQHQECVRRRATLSVAARPNCRDDVQAARVVNQVWDSCFSDTRPFDEIYR